MAVFIVLGLSSTSLLAQVFKIEVPSRNYMASECFGAEEENQIDGNFFLLKQKGKVIGVTAAHVIAAHDLNKKIKIDGLISLSANWKDKIADSFNDVAIYPADSTQKYFKECLDRALIADFEFSHLTKGMAVSIYSPQGNIYGKITRFGNGIENKICNQNTIECTFNKPVPEGYSGCPLVVKDKVIGMIIEAKNETAYAIGGNFLQKNIQDLMEYKHIQRPYLGVLFAEETTTQKPYIQGFMEVSPLRSAGARQKDLISQVNGINVSNLSELLTELDKCEGGNKINLQVKRENTSISINGIRPQYLKDADKQADKEYAYFPKYLFNNFTPKNGLAIWVPDNHATNLIIHYQGKGNTDAYTKPTSAGVDCAFNRNFSLKDRTWDDFGEILRFCCVKGHITILLENKEKLVYENGRILFH